MKLWTKVRRHVFWPTLYILVLNCSGCMKKLERQLQSTSIAFQLPVATSEAPRSPSAPKSPAGSKVNGLTESAHQHRNSSSLLKPSLPHSSDSSSRILLPDNGVLAFYAFGVAATFFFAKAFITSVKIASENSPPP